MRSGCVVGRVHLSGVMNLLVISGAGVARIQRWEEHVNFITGGRVAQLVASAPAAAAATAAATAAAAAATAAASTAAASCAGADSVAAVHLTRCGQLVPRALISCVHFHGGRLK